MIEIIIFLILILVKQKTDCWSDKRGGGGRDIMIL